MIDSRVFQLPWIATENGRRLPNVKLAVEEVLLAVGVDLFDPNFTGTPDRVARYLIEHFASPEELSSAIEEFRKAAFPSDYKGMVVVSPIFSTSICPHHLLPVTYTTSVAYLPQGTVIGLSKLPRTVEVYSKQAILQETLTDNLLHIFKEVLNTEHVIVTISGNHSCMNLRGARQRASMTTTTAVSGHFLTNSGGAKDEFLSSTKLSG